MIKNKYEKCKKTKSKYFDITKISTVSLETKHLKDFITRYSIYIFQQETSEEESRLKTMSFCPPFPRY